MSKPKGERVWCDNCGATRAASRVTVHYPDIPDLSERLDIGGEVPFGECPDCGALCYMCGADGKPIPHHNAVIEALTSLLNSVETEGCDGCGTVSLEAVNAGRKTLGWKPI